jgi:hypothetical protein
LVHLFLWEVQEEVQERIVLLGQERMVVTELLVQVVEVEGQEMVLMVE